MDNEPDNIFKIWVVYQNPLDYPESFVARLFHGETPTQTLMVTPEYLIIESMMLNMGLFKVHRQEGDQSHIVECWL